MSEADLTSSKRDALPIAAKEIVRFMLDDLIETWKDRLELTIGKEVHLRSNH